MSAANTDEALLDKINAAVADHNAAEQAVTTAQSDLVSKSRAVGQLLLEAKKLHPKVKDFEAFLKRVNGLKLSRAYDLLRLAGGRTTDEELRKDQRERKQRSRTKKKPPPQSRSLPEPESKSNTKPPLSVTSPHVTEPQEVSTEQRRAEMVALDSSAGDAEASARHLGEFIKACWTHLPKLVGADRYRARELANMLTSESKAEAA